MIQSYLKKRNLAALVYSAGIGLIIWHNKVIGKSDDWRSNVLLFATAGALIAACWFYLKAKKRTAGWLLLLPANVIALVVYWALEDHSERPDNVPCPKCGARIRLKTQLAAFAMQYWHPARAIHLQHLESLRQSTAHPLSHRNVWCKAQFIPYVKR